MLQALEALTKARLQGARPSVVFVTLGDAEQFPWWKDRTTVEIVIPDAEPVAKLDLRSLVRCDVIVIAEKRDERLTQVVRKVCEQARSVTVLSGEDPDDLGYAWERGSGWRRIGERFQEAA